MSALTSESVAFVAGATGLTGRAVVKELRQKNIRVIAHVRPDSSRLSEWKETFEAMGAEVDTTAWDEVAMSATMEQHRPNYVFALLGTTRARSREAAKQGNEENYLTVDYGLTVLLARAVLHAELSPVFVYLSSLGVHRDTQNSYLKARYMVETFLEESPLSYIIARPSFILGDRDVARPMERWGAFVADGLLKVAGVLGAGSLQRRYQSTDNHRLASALVRLALRPSAGREIVESQDLLPA